ncbi:agmatinase [Roseibium aggregatum]|uniref:Agmatinase n=1 Tax=Roseibium aggregatum TaxID=187304 RepID=A0A0M6YD72_9HYPH|nr:agmatinase [Roseibium aggregatum]CTQ47453.1 Agmatinase [Roseibium aggregatum]
MKIQTSEVEFGREGVFRTKAGPDGTFVEMPYSGIRTFMRRRPSLDFETADLAVYGIPFDLTTSGRSGARLGPSALREASTQLAWGEVWPWGFDPFDRLSVVDAGDIPFRRGQVQQMLDSATEFARRICAGGASTIMLGGDHCTTYTALKAHAEKHGPLALVQFDAHRDTQESDFLDHGTFVYHAIREGLIDPSRSIQIGIRTYYEDNDPMTVLYRDWLHEHGWRGALEKIRALVGDRPAYLSIDIDSLDPAFAPGTGTPVVDGLQPNDIISVLRDTVDINFVGMDLVEVAPPYDLSGSTALLGASLILEYICARAARNS